MTDNFNATVPMVSVEAYADLVGKSVRTVYRHLEMGAIPGAVHDGTSWRIPVDELVEPAPKRSVLPRRDTDVATTAKPRTVTEGLAHIPILLTLEQAGFVLEATPAQVDAMRRRGELEAIRRGRSWVITRASIMRLAGELR